MTVTEKLYVLPASVGVTVPEIKPAALSVSPGGSVPVSDHVYGAIPPVAASACEYATPGAAVGRLVVVMVRGLATVIDRFPVAVVAKADAAESANARTNTSRDFFIGRKVS